MSSNKVILGKPTKGEIRFGLGLFWKDRDLFLLDEPLYPQCVHGLVNSRNSTLKTTKRDCGRSRKKGTNWPADAFLCHDSVIPTGCLRKIAKFDILNSNLTEDFEFEKPKLSKNSNFATLIWGQKS